VLYSAAGACAPHLRKRALGALSHIARDFFFLRRALRVGLRVVEKRFPSWMRRRANIQLYVRDFDWGSLQPPSESFVSAELRGVDLVRFLVSTKMPIALAASELIGQQRGFCLGLHFSSLRQLRAWRALVCPCLRGRPCILGPLMWQQTCVLPRPPQRVSPFHDVEASPTITLEDKDPSILRQARGPSVLCLWHHQLRGSSDQWRVIAMPSFFNSIGTVLIYLFRDVFCPLIPLYIWVF
jgi:hypothetical protein